MPDGFIHGSNYHYYALKNDMKPMYYQNILGDAKQSINIWDPYFIVDASQFCKVNQDGISITILTQFKHGQAHDDLRTYLDNIVHQLEKNGVKQYKLCLRAYYNHISKLWHDRYLIIDKKDYYLVGTSQDSIVEPLRDYGIYKLTDDSNDKEIIWTAYQNFINQHHSDSNGLKRSK